MSAENDNKDELVPEDAAEETPQVEGNEVAAADEEVVAEAASVSGDERSEAGEPVDEQQARADEEATRAAEAAQEASDAADEAGTETAIAAAAEAEDAAETAQAAAETATEKPKGEKARKAREAEQAADQAEEAADEAKQSARRIRGRRSGRKSQETSTPERAVPVGLKVSAQAKYVRTSARKARLVCDHIRGKDVEQARAILAFTSRDAAKAWSKLLESAIANAENNHDLVGEDLRIYSVHADEGPTLKRYRPRAMGRATRIRKRTSHLSITLTPKES
jgi:ribosomal protein L22